MHEARCDLTRGTRVKSQQKPAFKVAHLAAGGIAFVCFIFVPPLKKALPTYAVPGIQPGYFMKTRNTNEYIVSLQKVKGISLHI